MKLDNMFKKPAQGEKRKGVSGADGKKPEVPDGFLKKCNKCGKAIIAEDARRGNYICPKCGGYFRMNAKSRIELIADEGSFEEWDKTLAAKNPLRFKGYQEKLELLKEQTGLDEAVVTGKIRLKGREAAFGVCDGRFMMASMGSVMGEKITRTIERATKERLPLILFICSGGARMQEGMISLMQMAKTAAALKRHSDSGLFSVNVLTDPTTGGVTASFGMLADIILAEPKALIGFAGPRVIEQTIGQKLPKGFQRSEFLLEHGIIDGIVERSSQRDVLARLAALHTDAAAQTKQEKPAAEVKIEEALAKGMEGRAVKKRKKTSAWERVQMSRKSGRPVGIHYIEALFTDFMELHGDRYAGDDAAVIGGIARFHGMPVTVIAQEKGTGTKENIRHNFGMPSPEGYRKALRLMKQAEKFSRPVVCFVDTPGAFPGIEAEERGQGGAIAENLFEMSALRVPVLSIVIGEGGSGGALALAVADEVWMLENATYSILSPEGFASILWKDSSRANEAARTMKLTAADLKKQKIIERIFPEPEDFTKENLFQVSGLLDMAMQEFFRNYLKMPAEELVENRYRRFRKF